MDFITILVLLIGAMTGALMWIKKRYSYWKEMSAPFIQPQFPYGNTKDFGKKMHVAEQMAQIYFEHKSKGPLVGIYFFLTPAAVILDLDLVRTILVKNFNNFPDRDIYYNERDDPISAHLFSLDGEPWKKLRSKMTPTFTSGKMKYMCPMVIEKGHNLSKKINMMLEESPDIEIRALMAKFTTDVIGSTAFGIECNSLFDKDAVFREMGRRAFEEHRYTAVQKQVLSSFKKAGRFLRMKWIRDDVSEFFTGVVRDTIKARTTQNIHRTDFMQILMGMLNSGDSESKLTLDEVAAQAFIFFAAGFETTSTTLAFCLYQLSKHPEIQMKARAHVEEILQKHDGDLNYESMSEMKYLDQLLNETLRQFPPVGTLTRSVQDDFLVPGTKYVLPANSTIIIPIVGIHSDPEIYPEPERFDPERFSADEINKRHPLSFLAFGDGPRNCIGLRFGKMQAKIGLAILLKNYKITPSSNTPDRIKIAAKNFVMLPDGGLNLHFEKIV